MGINILVDTKIHTFIGVLAGQIVDGTYIITNVASLSTVQVHRAGCEVYVSSTGEYPGLFELWNIKSATDGGYILDNIGLTTTQMLDNFVTAIPQNGEPCVMKREATVFNIEPAGGGTYVIKLQYKDLLWNVEPPVVPRGDIKLRPANGESTERFTLTPA